MPVYDDEAPRLAEIARRLQEVGLNLADFRSEVRSNFGEMVRKETYQVERDNIKERVAALETRNKQMTGILYGSLATLIISIIVSVVAFWITKGA